MLEIITRVLVPYLVPYYLPKIIKIHVLENIKVRIKVLKVFYRHVFPTFCQCQSKYFEFYCLMLIFNLNICSRPNEGISSVTLQSVLRMWHNMQISKLQRYILWITHVLYTFSELYRWLSSCLLLYNYQIFISIYILVRESQTMHLSWQKQLLGFL